MTAFIWWFAFVALGPSALQGSNPSFPCFTHHARLSSQNGIALRLWLIGTNRSVAVADDLPKELDVLLEPYLSMTSDDHSYVFGDFQICPIEEDMPGRIRHVRVQSGARLVIQNLRRERPPFRLLSTWQPAKK